MSDRVYEATIQPDDNEDGSLWEVTCKTPTNLHLVLEELTEDLAKRLAASLNKLEQLEARNG